VSPLGSSTDLASYQRAISGRYYRPSDGNNTNWDAKNKQAICFLDEVWLDHKMELNMKLMSKKKLMNFWNQWSCWNRQYFFDTFLNISAVAPSTSMVMSRVSRRIWQIWTPAIFAKFIHKTYRWLGPDKFLDILGLRRPNSFQDVIALTDQKGRLRLSSFRRIKYIPVISGKLGKGFWVFLLSHLTDLFRTGLMGNQDILSELLANGRPFTEFIPCHRLFLSVPVGHSKSYDHVTRNMFKR